MCRRRVSVLLCVTLCCRLWRSCDRWFKRLAADRAVPAWAARPMNTVTADVLHALAQQEPVVPVHALEVVYRVLVYSSGASPKPEQEFLVLGSQPLSDLRDHIYCLTDTTAPPGASHACVALCLRGCI